MMKHKNFGRIISAAAAATMLVAGIGVMPQSFEAEAAHSSNLSGQDAFSITSQMTIGWNLGNSLDCGDVSASKLSSPEKCVTAWGNPVPTAELVQTVKNAGFNTIRIPTTWYQHLEWDENSQMYLINEDWMDFVKKTVDYAYDLDMFVILNVHHEEWVNVGQFTDETYSEAALKLENIWTQVAEEFADYDQHLIFEGMNEPRQTGLGSSVEWGTGDTNSRKYINDLNAIFVDTIRSQGSSANSERLLMLPGYCASAEYDAVNAIEVPEGSGNVALSVHAYAPYYFTMATDDKANHEFPGASGWGENYESALNSLFSRLTQISQSKNVPIVIGEFGASDFNNTDSRVAWAKYYLGKAKEAGIPCVLWDNNDSYNGSGEAHGYLYRKTNTWYPNSAPVIKAMMDVYGVESVLPEYEEYVEPEFDWSKVPIGDDWVQLFRIENGKTYQAWGNGVVNGWQNYVNENYKIVMVYKSSSEPEIVFQGSGWNRIAASELEPETFMATYNYEDIVKALEAEGESMDTVTKMFVSATSEELTAYGVYAVPLHSETDEPTTDEPTEQPTEEQTTETKPNLWKGDVNLDDTVSVLDIVLLQKSLLGIETLSEEGYITADMNDDGRVNGVDLALLKRSLLQK